jgi:murein DD-endopeptidase MepM/ murein hydrolase activator NlpD
MTALYQRHIFALVLVIAALLTFVVSTENDENADRITMPASPVPFDNSLSGNEFSGYHRQPPVQGGLADAQPHPPGHLVTLKPGQNLTRLLAGQGISAHRVALLAIAARPLLDLGRLQTGTNIEVQHPTSGSHRVRLAREYGEVVEATYANNAWSVELKPVPTAYETQEQSLEIRSSLYQDAAQNNIPVDVINSAIMALSHFVDFQRQVQQGDILEVRYQRTQVSQDPALFAHLQNPLQLTYLRFTNAGEDHRLIRFNGAFYFPDGRLAQSFLMKTPLNGARLSSHFGSRRHPVLGYNRQHKGIDFSAPVGTPIMAAGAGVVKRASRFGSFGKTVIIQHSNGYETLYAHLKDFAGELRVGDRVKQGDIIGYLGNTGLSAGRHLHYEVHRHGRAINPLQLKASADIRLQGEELSRFKQQLARLNRSDSQLTSLAP